MMNATLAMRSTALALALLLVPASIGRAAQKKGERKKDTDAVVAVFTLEGPIQETPRQELFVTSAAGEPLKDLIRRMKKARDDDEVQAVVMLLGNTSLGAGQAEEIRRVMDEIKAVDKEVYVHTDVLSTGRYMLVSGASRLSMSPTGYLFLTGLYSEAPYVRGLLDKIGVVPDFCTCGAFKSAAETFMLTGPSPEAEQMNNWLLDSMFESYLELIAEGRGTSTKQVRKWIDGGLYSAEDARKLGIIDAVEFRSDFVAELKSRYGDGLEFDRKYAKKRDSDIDLSSPLGLLQLWAKLLGASDVKGAAKDAVAVIYVEGAIMPGKPVPSPFGSSSGAYSEPIRKALQKAASDDSIKAVVLRVDSPGGSAVASEIILNATKQVAAEKPFVVSMGNVAGSGGYYVACGAETIFADRMTVTASIGVLGGKFATTAMWDKVGIQWKSYARGRNADLLSSERVFTDPQREKLQGWMDEVYGVFKGHVVAIRGDRLKKPIDELAGGRVFTGAQALELGLVDEIGGLDQAVEHVARQAKLDDYELRVLPRPKNPMELLFGNLSGDKDDEGTISLGTGVLGGGLLGGGLLGRGLPSPHGQPELWTKVLPLIEGMDPERVLAVRQVFVRLEMLQKDGAVLMMPELLIGD